MVGWPYSLVAEHSKSESSTPARSDPTIESDSDTIPGSEYTNESSYESAGSSIPELASRINSCSNPCIT